METITPLPRLPDYYQFHRVCNSARELDQITRILCDLGITFRVVYSDLAIDYGAIYDINADDQDDARDFVETELY